MKMKIFKTTVLAGAFLFTASVAGEKTTEDYIGDLNAKDSYLQIEACRYLGEKKESSAVESLVFLLEDSNVDPHVKVASAAALGSIGKQEGVSDALLQSARESKNPSIVRYASFLALVSLKDEEKEEDIKELVVEMNDSSDPYLRDLAKKIAEQYKEKSE